jgi:hypothetical protein
MFLECGNLLPLSRTPDAPQSGNKFPHSISASPRHSREGGNPVRFLQPNGCQSKNDGALRRKLRFWIPAFAGMTGLKIASKTISARYPLNVSPKRWLHLFSFTPQVFRPSTSFLSRTAVRAGGNPET